MFHSLYTVVLSTALMLKSIYIYTIRIYLFSIGKYSYKYIVFLFIIYLFSYLNTASFAMDKPHKANSSDQKDTEESQQYSSDSEEELQGAVGGVPFSRPSTWYDKFTDRQLAEQLRLLEMEETQGEEKYKRREAENRREELLEKEERRREIERREERRQQYMLEQHNEHIRKRRDRAIRQVWIDNNQGCGIVSSSDARKQLLMVQNEYDKYAFKLCNAEDKFCKKRLNALKFLLQKPIHDCKSSIDKLERKKKELVACKEKIRIFEESFPRILFEEKMELIENEHHSQVKTYLIDELCRLCDEIKTAEEEIEFRRDRIRFLNDENIILINSYNYPQPTIIYTCPNRRVREIFASKAEELVTKLNQQEAKEFDEAFKKLLKEEGSEQDLWFDAPENPILDIQFSDVAIDSSDNEEEEPSLHHRQQAFLSASNNIKSIHKHDTPLRSDNLYPLPLGNNPPSSLPDEEEEASSSSKDILVQGQGSDSTTTVTTQSVESEQHPEGDKQSFSSPQAQQDQSQGQQLQVQNSQTEGAGSQQDYTREGARPKARGIFTSKLRRGPEGGTSFIPGYSLGGHISSLYGMQSILVDISEQVAFTLKNLALKAQQSVFVKDDAMQLNENTSIVSKKKKQTELAALQHSKEVQELMSYRVIGFTDTKKTNLEYKVGSSQVGFLINPTAGLGVGLAYSRYKDATKEHQGIAVFSSASGSVKTRAELDGLGVMFAWNPKGQGITGHVAGYYGWGELKNTRSFTHGEAEVSASGTPDVSLSGGLVQLGYTIPVSKKVSLTPYVECMVSTVSWNPYKERIGLLPSEISGNIEKVLEKSIGLCNCWEINHTSFIQSWVVGVSSYQSTEKLSAKPLIAGYSSTYKTSIPSHTKRRTKAEVGISYKSQLTSNLEVGFHSKVQLEKERKTPQQQVNVQLQYVF